MKVYQVYEHWLTPTIAPEPTARQLQLSSPTDRAFSSFLRTYAAIWDETNNINGRDLWYISVLLTPIGTNGKASFLFHPSYPWDGRSIHWYLHPLGSVNSWLHRWRRQFGKTIQQSLKNKMHSCCRYLSNPFPRKNSTLSFPCKLCSGCHNAEEQWANTIYKCVDTSIVGERSLKINV